MSENKTNTPVTPEDQLKDLCCHDACKGKATYQVQVTCINCDWSGSIELTRGHEFSRYSSSCKGCGCSTLIRKSR